MWRVSGSCYSVNKCMLRQTAAAAALPHPTKRFWYVAALTRAARTPLPLLLFLTFLRTFGWEVLVVLVGILSYLHYLLYFPLPYTGFYTALPAIPGT